MPVTITVEVENEVQAERVRQFLRYAAMSPDEQAAERARLHEAARERHLAALPPELAFIICWAGRACTVQDFGAITDDEWRELTHGAECEPVEERKP